ncbi:concanavalin A-like lectin/glucanase [Aureococcus anophagefferens]|nr:concanavalin A-like lectin/glucanase [Aureococcus anophagefferens]
MISARGCLSLVAACLAATSRATATLVAYYSFDDGTAAEDSDSSLDGTISGAWASTGPDGSGALSFDGGESYVQFPDALTSGILGSNARTVCLWAAISSFNDAALFTFGDYADGEEFALMTAASAGEFIVQFYGGDYDTDVSVSEWSDDDGWHHYCLVYDGADWSLYVDGAVAHTATASLNTGSENPLTIGVRDNESYLGGSVDELYVYSSALSESEIQTLYVGDTLIAHYSFDDGTAAEDSDSSLDGTISGATATTGQYGIGGALSFDGSDDYVEFPSAVTADILGSAARTVCLWAVINAFDGGSLFSYGSESDGRQFTLRLLSDPGAFRMQFFYDDNDVTLPGVDTGEWHHYCLAYDGATCALYVDGAEAESSSYSVTGNTGSEYPLTLGLRGGNNGYFDGSIDEVYVYSSALDAASIQVLYDAVTTAPTVTPLPTHVSHSTLIAHYSFDDGTAAEDSDSSLDGTISGATATTGQYGIGGALSFDGSDDHVEFPDAVTADILGSSARTVCLWAVIGAFDKGTLFSYDSNSAGQRFSSLTGTTTGEISLSGWGTSYGFDVAVSGSDDGDWHHYCHTYDGTDWLLYFDGTLARTETVALDTGSDNPLTLGVRYSGGYTGYFSGSIDEVYVYSSALDAASIQVLYDAVTVAPTVTPLPTSNFFQATLVAHYSFDDGTAAEDSDGSLDGTISGATATTGRDGSGALSFDGSDDYVEFPDAVTVDILGSSARSICLWAVVDVWDGQGMLFSYDSNVASQRFSFMVESTAGEFGLLGFTSDYDSRNIEASGSDDGDWHHYCLTYDGTDWLLYFDGTLLHTETVALDTGSDNPLTLGVRYTGGYTGYFDGSIDEVYVYASALDAASIQVLYAAVTTAPTVTPLPTHVSHSTLVAHYSFDDGTAAEDSDSSLDGTISGATATTGQYGIGGALSFDGSDDYVEFPDAVTVDILGSSARTICLWAVIGAFDKGTIFSYDSNSAGQRFSSLTGTTTGETFLSGWGTTSYEFDVAVSGSDDGDWHHYCHTYDGTDWLLYYDGTLVHTETVALDTGSDNPLTLGVRYSGGYTGYFSGAIDEVYVYSSALDAASIQVLYDAVTTAPTVTPLPTHVSHSTLIAHYSFDDGEAEDDYGGLDGTIHGATPTTGHDGSGALAFDGTNDYVEFPSAVTADILGSSARTVCLWAAVDAFDEGGFFQYGSINSAYASYALRSSPTAGSVAAQFWGGDTSAAIGGDDDGGWHHYCLTYDGSDWVLYIDGSQAATAALALDTGSDTSFELGVWSGNFFSGSIDEVYVYSSALDAASIEVLYNAVTAAPTVTPLPTSHFFQGTLVAYYSFDDGTAADDHGSLDGTINGPTATTGRDGSGALSFDGSDDYVAFPAGVTADILGSSARTVCLWAAVDAFDEGGFFQYGSINSAYASYALRSSPTAGSVAAQFWGGDTSAAIGGDDDGGWHHYCLTYDGSDWVLYIDGSQARRAALDTGSDTSFELGVWSGNFFSGSIDEVYVYSSALDAASIEVLYNAVTAAPTVTPLPTSHFFQGTLVAYYSFDDGTAADDHGSLDGTINGPTATTGRDGSGALSFDGSDDYVAFPAGVTADILGSSARTVCLWVAIDAFDEGGFFQYGSINSAYASYALRSSPTAGSVWAQFWGGDTSAAIGGDDDGGWHHYCLTYDGSDWVLYIDGSQAATATLALDTGSDTSFELGVWSGNFFSGSIDEVYVYSSALDAASIQVVYGIGTGSTCVAHVDCEIRWVYRGDPSACETVDIQLVETGEDEVLNAQTTENDGEVSKTVPGDAEVNEYTVTVACSDDATISDSYDFQRGSVRRAVVVAERGAVPFSERGAFFESFCDAERGSVRGAVVLADGRALRRALAVPEREPFEQPFFGALRGAVVDAFRRSVEQPLFVSERSSDHRADGFVRANHERRHGIDARVIPGDAEVNEYTMTVAADGDADDGGAFDGRSDHGITDDGVALDARAVDGRAHDGPSDDGRADDGRADRGALDRGADDRSSDDGQAIVGPHVSTDA